MLVTNKNNLEIEVNDDAFDNMETLDALEEMNEGNPLAISKLCNLLFTKAEKKKIYDFTGTIREELN